MLNILFTIYDYNSFVAITDTLASKRISGKLRCALVEARRIVNSCMNVREECSTGIRLNHSRYITVGGNGIGDGTVTVEPKDAGRVFDSAMKLSVCQVTAVAPL